jgi:hypothetical protein
MNTFFTLLTYAAYGVIGLLIYLTLLLFVAKLVKAHGYEEKKGKRNDIGVV